MHATIVTDGQSPEESKDAETEVLQRDVAHEGT
jgi:hypothetical protein